MEIHSYVTEKGWGILCTKPEKAYEGVVREFYPNAFIVLKEDEEENEEPVNPYTSFVRGKEVDFSPNTLNELFGLSKLITMQGSMISHIMKADL